ncbi:MAG: hypothetical protein CL910_13095 [Deltaproteobacteria bacterium]|jgi:hypothetical protein|nr:hypothetical protein [Deltaproteobacteria bacterium]
MLAMPAAAEDLWLVGQGEELRIQDGPHEGVQRSFSRVATSRTPVVVTRRSHDWTGSEVHHGAPTFVYYGTPYVSYRPRYDTGYRGRHHHYGHRYRYARPYGRFDRGWHHRLGRSHRGAYFRHRGKHSHRGGHFRENRRGGHFREVRGLGRRHRR